MYSIKQFVRIHKLNIAIFLFLILFSLIHYLKPSIFYNEEGGFRPFGVGYRHKTVIPIWVISIIMAILCYLAISYTLYFL
jgi:hypothetical protein